MKPSRHEFSVLKQVVELIPRNLVPKLARKHGVDKKSRTFTPWSHVVSLLFAQLSHALSLNDICDTLRNHSGAIQTVRRAEPPSRNGLSHANRERNADMAEALFWETLDNLQQQAANSGAKWTPNPEENGQWFRGKVDSESGVMWTDFRPGPEWVSTLTGLAVHDGRIGCPPWSGIGVHDRPDCGGASPNRCCGRMAREGVLAISQP